jgi:hypothetical protein
MPPRLPPTNGARDQLGVKPTKRRKRKPESLAFLDRAFGEGLHVFDLPHAWRDQPPRRYKTIAEALKLKLARKEWAGNDQQGNPIAILRRVRQALEAAGRDAPEPEREIFDNVVARIDALLDPDHGSARTLWNADEGRYVVSPEACALLKDLWKSPVIRPHLLCACQQLEDEYDARPIAGWHPGAPRHQAVTKQLRKEIGDGERLAERLRDLRRNARERGDLPRRER